MSFIKKFDYKKYIVYESFFIVLIVFSIILRNKGFLSPENLMNILRQTAMISVSAVGMTFAISAGLIDLSVGSTIAMSSLTTAMLLKVVPLPIAVLGGLLIGLTAGLINGVIVSKVRIPAFLVTLGTSGIFAGIARTMTNLEAIPVTNKYFNFIFGSGDIGFFSTLFIWTLIIAALGQIVYKKTSFGRCVLAIGGNEAAAKYSGIKIDKVKIMVMMICSSSAAMAGILYAGRLNGARYTLGENDLMTIIASVVIGGTSFTGGKGTVAGTIIGSIVMGMLNNGLLLMGLTVSEQMIARGIIIILAVSLSLRESKKD